VKRLAILGASGHGKVVADAAELCGWQEIVFYDDAWPEKSQLGCWIIKGNTASLLQSLSAFDGVIVAIGDNHIRAAKISELSDKGAALVSMIHPSAMISQYAKIGAGSVVFANVVVNVDANIGAGVILNTACTIDHDCKLGDAVHISPGANIAGGVSIGSRSWVGIGACVRQCVEIGEDVVAGAGAVVVNDIDNKAVVVGNPAKPIRINKC